MSRTFQGSNAWPIASVGGRTMYRYKLVTLIVKEEFSSVSYPTGGESHISATAVLCVLCAFAVKKASRLTQRFAPAKKNPSSPRR